MNEAEGASRCYGEDGEFVVSKWSIAGQGSQLHQHHIARMFIDIFFKCTVYPHKGLKPFSCANPSQTSDVLSKRRISRSTTILPYWLFRCVLVALEFIDQSTRLTLYYYYCTHLEHFDFSRTHQIRDEIRLGFLEREPESFMRVILLIGLVLHRVSVLVHPDGDKV